MGLTEQREDEEGEERRKREKENDDRPDEEYVGSKGNTITKQTTKRKKMCSVYTSERRVSVLLFLLARNENGQIIVY